MSHPIINLRTVLEAQLCSCLCTVALTDEDVTCAQLTPLRRLPTLPVLDYDPVVCSTCPGVLNPHAHVDFQSFSWTCPIWCTPSSVLIYSALHNTLAKRSNTEAEGARCTSAISKLLSCVWGDLLAVHDSAKTDKMSMKYSSWIPGLIPGLKGNLARSMCVCWTTELNASRNRYWGIHIQLS
jgi:hypothetical protein